MPTKTHGKQAPYGIRGTVTVDSSTYQGAMIWVRDMDEGTVPDPIDDKTVVYTDAVGRYLINVSQSTQAASLGDTVYVFCKVGDIISKSEITTSSSGYHTVNFTITRLHGGVDGLKGTSLTSGKGGLYKGLRRDMNDGLV